MGNRETADKVCHEYEGTFQHSDKDQRLCDIFVVSVDLICQLLDTALDALFVNKDFLQILCKGVVVFH